MDADLSLTVDKVLEVVDFHFDSFSPEEVVRMYRVLLAMDRFGLIASRSSLDEIVKRIIRVQSKNIFKGTLDRNAILDLAKCNWQL